VEWSVATSLEGNDLDDCPDQGSDPPNPKKGTLSSQYVAAELQRRRGSQRSEDTRRLAERSEAA
jgi:hypothetical protein